GGMPLDHALFRGGVLGDLREQVAVTGAALFVASAIGECDRPDVVRAAQSDGDRTLQVTDQIARSASKLAKEYLAECQRAARHLRANDDNRKNRSLASDEDVHRVTECVRVEECVAGPEPVRLRDEGYIGWMGVYGLSSGDSYDVATGPLRHRPSPNHSIHPSSPPD